MPTSSIRAVVGFSVRDTRGSGGAGPLRLTHETPESLKAKFVTNGNLNVFKLTMSSIQNFKHLFTNVFYFLPSGASQSCARMQISHVRQTEEGSYLAPGAIYFLHRRMCRC